MENKKVMLSGIQPSGDLHLGNYLGAIKNWGARAEEFDCFYFMADMHTITVRQERYQQKVTLLILSFVILSNEL